MSDYRSDIQWLRGLAVIGVILFHAKETLFSNGYLGVDVFFVISGYVVAPLLIRVFDTRSYKQIIKNLFSFYRRRFWRLVPPLGFVLGASVLLVLLFGSPSEHWRIAQQGLYSLIIIGNIGAIKFSGNYFSPTPNPFIHTWSLSVEEQFYLGIPLVLLMISIISRNRNKIRFIAVIILGLLSFASFSFPAFFSSQFTRFGFPTEIDFAFYSGLTRCWQFLIGLGAYVFSSRQKKPSTFSWIGNLAFFLLVILLFSILVPGTYLGSCLASIFTLLALNFGVTSNYTKRLSFILTWIGDRSYSFYLVHMPLLYLGKYSPVFEIFSRTDRAVQSIIAVFSTFVLGTILYGTIEKRSRGFGRSSSTDSKPKIVLLVVTLLIPLLLLTAMNFGTRNNYWGFMHNLHTPEYPGFLDPNCQRDSNAGPPCIYKSKAAHSSVLMIGDSHAGHYSEALITASKRENWNAIIWAKSSCSFVLGRDNSNSLSESCLTRNREIVDWIVVNQPQSVIVSQYIYQTSDQGDLRRSLLALKQLVPNVSIIENNPVFPDEKDFMVAKPLVMKPYKAPKRFLISEMNYRDFQASTQLLSWANNSGIKVMRTWSLFCEGSHCSRFDENGWLYTDDDHLSVNGATRIIPFFRDFLISK